MGKRTGEWEREQVNGKENRWMGEWRRGILHTYLQCTRQSKLLVRTNAVTLYTRLDYFSDSVIEVSL